MACILKAPSNDSKGIVVFTTQERNHLILKQRKLQYLLQSLKPKWVIGMHHNWHDFQFKYNDLFDFHMAGDGDLIEVDSKTVPLINMDACNFVPDCFRPADNEKFWDILYVARAVGFKKIPEFFQCIRKLYDDSKRYRVLFICPVPPYERKERKTVFYKVRDVYSSLFSESEQNLFNLMTIDYRYPFPLDLETLAFYYRSSKIFVHFADNERRCRVAAYAWASGIPVVGMQSVASLLPKHMQRSPYYYEVSDYDLFPDAINNALDKRGLSDEQLLNVRNCFCALYTKAVIDQKMETFFRNNKLAYSSKDSAYHNLDIRLGRHHGLGNNPNIINTDLNDFIKYLSVNHDDVASLLNNNDDPEKTLQSLMMDYL